MIPNVFSGTALSRVTAPILVMIGDREIIYAPGEALERAARTIADVQTALVPGAGHLLNVQMPALVDARVLEFFAEAHSRVG